MKQILVTLGIAAALVAVVVVAQPADALYIITPVDINGALLRDGDLISANQSAGDPDIFIIKLLEHVDSAYDTPGNHMNGFKRLFLSPAIFGMYGHLGGYARVRQVTAEVRDSFVTSGLFRNCETGDRRVWATEVTGEDNGIFHHVDMSGDQASAEDVRFFDKVFCINSREDAFYARSIYPYTRLRDIPPYHRRACQVRPSCLDSSPRCLLPEPIGGWCPSPVPYCESEGRTVPSTGGDRCCAGLVAVPVKDTNDEVVSGMSSWICARPGCFYRQVQCVRAPCPPVLECPTRGSCGGLCSTDADCADNLRCYQPPFSCPSGQYCAQVMPAKICRHPDNLADTNCRRI